MFTVALIALGCGTPLAAEAPWGPSQNGFASRITCVTKEPTLGKPIQFQLEIKNTSDKPVNYDDQQATVNNPFDITGPDQKPVPYIGGSCQTMGHGKSLAPGANTTIFTNVDIDEPYLLDKPGKHTIKFKTQHYGQLPASNELVIDIKPGTVTDTTKLIRAYHDKMPKGWRVARHGSSIAFVNSPTGLIADVATITISFTKENKPNIENATSLGKTKMGYAWLDITGKNAIERWPDHMKFAEEHLKAYQIREW